MKQTYLFSLISTVLFALQSYGQCSYEYQNTDPISEKTVFKTKSEKLSKGINRKGSFKCSSVLVSLENSGTQEFMWIDIKNPWAFGRPIFFTSYDSLTVKFDDKSMISINVSTASVSAVSGLISFQLNPDAIDKLKSRKVTAIRITGQGFNLDVTEFEVELQALFETCWLD
jgi:hypothetical protein